MSFSNTGELRCHMLIEETSDVITLQRLTNQQPHFTNTQGDTHASLLSFFLPFLYFLLCTFRPSFFLFSTSVFLVFLSFFPPFFLSFLYFSASLLSLSFFLLPSFLPCTSLLSFFHFFNLSSPHHCELLVFPSDRVYLLYLFIHLLIYLLVKMLD